MTRGFVDLLFILLCGALIMLSQSVRVHSPPVDPADAGHSRRTRLRAGAASACGGRRLVRLRRHRFDTIPELRARETLALVLVPPMTRSRITGSSASARTDRRSTGQPRYQQDRFRRFTRR